MTNPNWWDVEPFAKQNHCVAQYDCDCKGLDHDLPLIIEEVKRRERGETTVKDMGRGELFARWFKCLSCDSDEIIEDTVFCPHCGLKINWK